MPTISIQKREDVIDLFRKGNSKKKISNMLNISRGSVQCIVKKFERTGNIKNLPKTGRPKKYSTIDTRRLIIMSKCNPFHSSAELNANWKSSKDVSNRTVRRILCKYGLYGRISCKKPMLNNIQKRTRYRWCILHRSWTINEWKFVIFSDEVKFDLYPNRKRIVRRFKNTRFDHKNISPSMKFGYRSVMFWGAIKYDGTMALVEVDGILNSIKYQELLMIHLLPAYEHDKIFQQDGASCHRSKSTMEFLANQNIQILEKWPSQSPDINIIENIWSILKTNVFRRQPKSIDDIKRFCQEEWNLLSPEYIKSLYHSIPRRLNQIIKVKGLNTKY